MGSLPEDKAPECPEVLQYLVDWAYQLLGRSGIDMGGLSPLTWTTLHAWSDVMQIRLFPHEADALLQLDAILRHPDKVKEDKDDPVQEAPKVRAWPGTKNRD